MGFNFGVDLKMPELPQEYASRFEKAFGFRQEASMEMCMDGVILECRESW